MTRLFPFIIVIGFLASCATHLEQTRQTVPPPKLNLPAPYSVGMAREEVRTHLKDSWLLVATPHPVGGWRQIPRPVGARVARFERSHACVVGACDVYWVGRTYAPRIFYGIWLDYFFFDRDDKLIGFERSLQD